MVLLVEFVKVFYSLKHHYSIKGFVVTLKSRFFLWKIFIQFNEHRSPVEGILVIDVVIGFVDEFPTTNWCKLSLELFDDVCEGKLTNTNKFIWMIKDTISYHLDSLLIVIVEKLMTIDSNIDFEVMMIGINNHLNSN